MRAAAVLASAVVIGLLMQGLVAGPAYASHYANFKGQGLDLNLELLLLALTAVAALLCFGALIAIVRFWERRDEEGARQAQELTSRHGKGES